MSTSYSSAHGDGGILHRQGGRASKRRRVEEVHVWRARRAWGGIVTNMKAPSRAVVRFCSQRGTAEVAAATIKEGKQAMKMTRLSCHRFRSNEVPVWLSVIAYNLGNLWR